MARAALFKSWFKIPWMIRWCSSRVPAYLEGVRRVSQRSLWLCRVMRLHMSSIRVLPEYSCLLYTSGSRSLYLEEWVDGSLVGSDILMQGDGEANMTCYLLSDIDKREDGTWSGTTWKMILESDGTKTASGALRTVFPDGKKGGMAMTGIYGETADAGRKKKADKHADDVGNAPAAGYVLAARCFQFDRNSMESVDCEEMAEDDSVFRKYDYVVLVRLAVDG